MLKFYPIFIGWKNFTSGSDSNLVSFLSFLSISGLALGTALLILVMSIMNGFEREMESTILGSVPHVQIFRESGVSNTSALTQLLDSDHNVRATTPFSKVDGMLTSNGRAMPVELLGIGKPQSKDFAGSFLSPELLSLFKEKEDNFLLAKGVADKLLVKVGDMVVLLAPQAEVFDHDEFAPKIVSFRVGGIFSTHTPLDQKLVLGPLKTVTQIAGLKDPQGVQIKLNNVFDARETGFRLIRALPPGYLLSDWVQTHGNLYQAIKMSRKMILLLVFFILAIAVFNVVSMLMMVVIDKRSAISVLKTQGAKNFEIAFIFMTQGLLIGLTGSFLGAIVGIFGALNAPAVMNKIESLLGFNFLESEVYPIDYLPSQLIWGDVFLVILAAVALNLIVTIYPSLQAAKVKPATELRYE
jgi:lipoprotein-releasing system permease protein|tara:strand:+ start:3283 stop:4518 length:1236 start_codon:yes stop_codon:yes gene_type:complete